MTNYEIGRLMSRYPIGTLMHLADDDPEVDREVYGYEFFSDNANLIFLDGTRLSVDRMELIEEVKVSYDVEVPKNHCGQSIYAEKFWEFYESDHESMEMDCETLKEGQRAQHILCMLRDRNHIFDVHIRRRKNVVYVARGDTDDIT